ncbi:LysM peptidoglycan-binding domain-containing protein [Actinorugispora endophytica]|uniref:LysM domain-containing protein n=1 Tax=Actinorugispora endophytica TaxID=1605990 RepID=A0A4R6USA8_9ACTN|nr:LysM peptidoglycan-binding domain-containing protein [Actinorugispora endophytica]TDQ48205.1 LysM domain-containing protein [Actinorugispora endophytica]
MSEPALPLAPVPPAPRSFWRPETTAQARGAGSRPSLYDWSREIPEWRARSARTAGRPCPVLAGLPDLGAAVPAKPVRSALGGPPRLTRRGRVVLVSLLGSAAATSFVFVALAAMAMGASSAGASTESFFQLPESPTVVVGEGDTLWEIAERARPFEDPRKTVDEIVEINELPGPVLKPGQELLLPAS